MYVVFNFSRQYLLWSSFSSEIFELFFSEVQEALTLVLQHFHAILFEFFILFLNYFCQSKMKVLYQIPSRRTMLRHVSRIIGLCTKRFYVPDPKDVRDF